MRAPDSWRDEVLHRKPLIYSSPVAFSEPVLPPSRSSGSKDAKRARPLQSLQSTASTDGFELRGERLNYTASSAGDRSFGSNFYVASPKTAYAQASGVADSDATGHEGVTGVSIFTRTWPHPQDHSAGWLRDSISAPNSQAQEPQGWMNRSFTGSPLRTSGVPASFDWGQSLSSSSSNWFFGPTRLPRLDSPDQIEGSYAAATLRRPLPGSKPTQVAPRRTVDQVRLAKVKQQVLLRHIGEHQLPGRQAPLKLVHGIHRSLVLEDSEHEGDNLGPHMVNLPEWVRLFGLRDEMPPLMVGLRKQMEHSSSVYSPNQSLAFNGGSGELLGDVRKKPFFFGLNKAKLDRVFMQNLKELRKQRSLDFEVGPDTFSSIKLKLHCREARKIAVEIFQWKPKQRRADQEPQKQKEQSEKLVATVAESPKERQSISQMPPMPISGRQSLVPKVLDTQKLSSAALVEARAALMPKGALLSPREAKEQARELEPQDPDEPSQEQEEEAAAIDEIVTLVEDDEQACPRDAEEEGPCTNLFRVKDPSERGASSEDHRMLFPAPAKSREISSDEKSDCVNYAIKPLLATGLAQEFRAAICDAWDLALIELARTEASPKPSPELASMGPRISFAKAKLDEDFNTIPEFRQDQPFYDFIRASASGDALGLARVLLQKARYGQKLEERTSDNRSQTRTRQLWHTRLQRCSASLGSLEALGEFAERKGLVQNFGGEGAAYSALR